jgi:alkanesulfonate monooxygenase
MPVEFCWMLPQGDLQRITKETQLAEDFGFHSVLLINANDYMDPWVVAAALALQTSRIRLLVAQNTSYVLPTAAAKAFSTLNVMSGGRVDINVVTGSSPIEMGRMTQAANHETRYRRTREFVELFLQLQQQKVVHYRGEFFAVQQAELYPRMEEGTGQVFVAGSSQAAMGIAASFADYYLVFAHDYPVIQEQFAAFLSHVPSERHMMPKCGIMVDIIARETSQEAWDTAERLLEQRSPLEKRMNRLFRNNCDSVGIQNYQSYYAKPGVSPSANLWSGLAQLNTSNGISIVGSYEEVQAALQRFHRLGADYFIVSGLAGPGELEIVGRYVLPGIWSGACRERPME